MKLDLNKLSRLNEVAKEGSRNVADNLTQMLSIDIDMTINRISIISIPEVPEDVCSEEMIGVYLCLDGLPSGYFITLFPIGSAKKISNILLDGIEENSSDDEENSSVDLTEMDMSTISEVGNIITSLFIDGWANLLESEIDMSVPYTVSDNGSSVLTSLISEVAKDHEYAFLFNSLIHTPDKDVRCELYLIPENGSLAQALERV
ncbi:MAG: chemotaxis protein CheC [Halobacteriota archaeon]